ncbi:hypothetical protein [Variovorax sp. J22R115]|uniref:hypothetical protein n=1 Tax=Variovorax sp. J22R115 TaxID=3053509 RepID=UPI0025777FE7|nr:hypothetical protein [Variovorax sp. J22R115]MDM0053911.1 hypothetical protein [Variovorax sp. J22R115]
MTRKITLYPTRGFILVLALLPISVGLLAIPSRSGAQVTQLAAGAMTSVAVDDLFQNINGSIQQFQDAGDYLMVEALVRAKDALDAWKATNSELMDRAFAQLDDASKQNFGRIRQAVADVNDAGKARLATIQFITLSANQLVARLPGGRPYVAAFSPRVMPTTVTSAYTIRLSGVSLDVANTRMTFPDGKTADRTVIGPQEVQFRVPLAQTPAIADKMQVYTLKVTYTQPRKGFTSWLAGSTEDVVRELPVVVMPANIGVFSITGERVFKRKEVAEYTADLGQVRGKNTTIARWAMPKNGWKWDLTDTSKFAYKHTSADNGKCARIDWNGSSENGIRVEARVDKIGPSTKYPRGAPGKVSCILTGPTYAMAAGTQPYSANGTLPWNKDSLIVVPEDLSKLQVHVRTFDGRERVFQIDDSDRFFDLRVAKGSITFVPKVPEDILASQ